MDALARFTMADLRALFRLPIRSRAPLPAHSVPSAGTFNAGRNAEKRAARDNEAKNRRDLVKLRDAAYTFDIPNPPRKGGVPKVRCSRLVTDMLANRRLRQRGVRS